MVGGWIVEIDGLLHEAEAEDARVEIHIALRVARDRGDVVDAVQSQGGRLGCAAGVRGGGVRVHKMK
jgi:hypothetical protein